ncbi:hypothetical protein H696_03216 [Fonticula alba]|uniref:Uncharacterized protein n=1 Tax=Fonticula alba TaxID=691883 RepID=A0A058ZA81_FONAL|nr:hypothetical protein H696_03216 [Fonticula alba]KCV70858.1 hypothetical protein H696_03216 [Fonticula alba]|eukprot:XP_009495374.1 hypothetical protein H696_03216 [Fonticula alba]
MFFFPLTGPLQRREQRLGWMLAEEWTTQGVARGIEAGAHGSCVASVEGDRGGVPAVRGRVQQPVQRREREREVALGRKVNLRAVARGIRRASAPGADDALAGGPGVGVGVEEAGVRGARGLPCDRGLPGSGGRLIVACLRRRCGLSAGSSRFQWERGPLAAPRFLYWRRWVAPAAASGAPAPRPCSGWSPEAALALLGFEGGGGLGPRVAKWHLFGNGQSRHFRKGARSGMMPRKSPMGGISPFNLHEGTRKGDCLVKSGGWEDCPRVGRVVLARSVCQNSSCGGQKRTLAHRVAAAHARSRLDIENSQQVMEMADSMLTSHRVDKVADVLVEVVLVHVRE